MKQNPVMTMIIPGRRALGENWSKVNITIDENGHYGVEREDTPAPATNVPIFVPGMGNISAEMADYILEWHRKEAEYKAKNPSRPRAETQTEQINRMWFDYLEWKKKMLRHQTFSGPAGWAQRSG